MDGSQLVIVALPSEEDYVRKLSSEKEPHLTLLYLGDNTFTQEQLTHVTDFIEYAASLLPRFTLDVESRGELGDNKADVLFFNNQWSKNVATFRAQLMQDPLISAAYNSTDQFPEWSPHLTMGYPETPAKKDTRDYPGVSYVRFDRIALWTGESTGPTFPMKREDYEMAVAMSEIDRGRSIFGSILSSSTRMSELSHYGIKGMKWGVSRSDSPGGSSSGQKPSPSEDALNAAKTAQKIKAGGGIHVLDNNELQQTITRMNLESQYRNLTTNKKSDLDKGLALTQKALKVGATVENTRRFMETPTGKAVKAGLKAAFAAAKVGAAFKTGGASSAAGAGASLVVQRMGNHYTNVGR